MDREQLIQKMNERGYSYLSSQYRDNGEEYVITFIHENGMSTTSFQKRENTWESCF